MQLPEDGQGFVWLYSNCLYFRSLGLLNGKYTDIPKTTIEFHRSGDLPKYSYEDSWLKPQYIVIRKPIKVCAQSSLTYAVIPPIRFFIKSYRVSTLSNYAQPLSPKVSMPYLKSTYLFGIIQKPFQYLEGDIYPPPSDLSTTCGCNDEFKFLLTCLGNRLCNCLVE